MTNNLKELDETFVFTNQHTFESQGDAPFNCLKCKKCDKFASHHLNYAVRESILTLINQKEKEAFYAGQAMAGVTLQRCHESWARWNLPKEEKDRIKTFNPPQEKWLQEYPKQLKEELNKKGK